MRRVSDVLLEDLDEIAELLTNEQGKPRVESYTMEILPTVDSLNWIADHGPDILSDEKLSMPPILKMKRAKFTYEPIGVVGVIAPWNYPWSIPFGEVAIALMAGNGVVLKPEPDAVDRRADQADLREGRVPGRPGRTIHGGGRVGTRWSSRAPGRSSSPDRSSRRKVGVECAKRMKGSVLELGSRIRRSSAPMPISPTRSRAPSGADSRTPARHAPIERVYVHRDVADEFLDGVVRETERLTVGEPREWTTEIGPMVSDEQAQIVRELVDDAVKTAPRSSPAARPR
jgi:succinate-semialdehyde dehydrogenase/glutarate-semialdehyde dehydrogenase